LIELLARLVMSGPAFILPVIAMAYLYPGAALTRHLVAAAQMLVSIILIDVTGGRIESHFHVFGSLAFLAAYRDWRVLTTASLITAADHFARGIWLPMSVYGELTASPLRVLEHTWWVVFEDFFLILTIFRSITEMKDIATARSQLHQGAYYDVLTGLANRRLLQESWDRSVQRHPSTSKAVLFIDLDRFKQVNDTHGHTVGDKLLLQVATRLTASFHEPALLARIGGDEFVVLLEGVGADVITETGSCVLKALNQSFLVDGHHLLLSATIGIAMYPENGRSLSVLQERADQAMYVAKANGRNRVNFFSIKEQERADAVLQVTRDLFQAMGRGEFHLVFQPIVDRFGEISAFEALLRWSHPRQGSVSPAEFIPMAERSGLIVPIGDWVMAEACRQCQLWQRERARPIGIAVNISAVQFNQEDFPAQVESILREAGLSPSLLTLELTETVLLDNLDRARNHLGAIRTLGVRMSLDDFGTGYSSLTYLNELPVQAIKLDRAFIRNQFGKTSGILSLVIEMAHRLGLDVVGEGVEEEVEVQWLLDLGCDQLQGFRFSPPLESWLVPEYVASQEVQSAIG
jgi:diguanylate cyclase (GGDEF)-like protein